MKKTAYLLAILVSAIQAQAAVIEQVIVRQQWPWSTDVKVEYKLSGVTAPVDIRVAAYNGGVPLDPSRLNAAITGELYGIATDGIGEFIIDPVTAFGTSQVALANFKVKLSVSDSPASMNEVLYKIFDLSTESGTFPCTDVTRADILNGKYGSWETNYANVATGFSTGLSDCLVWTGVTNRPNAKTTELVMRKIPAGTFQMGQTGGVFAGSNGNAERVHDVTLTKDFYIGVYPVTQEQYRKLTRGVWNGSGHKGNAFPVESAAYDVFQSVVTNGIAANLGVSVDFPTEAQWEYACRAGTTSELYSGLALTSAHLDPIAWHSGNSSETTCEVGLKLPNAFGLYDMIGNVYEACSDFWEVASKLSGYSDGTSVTDPKGPVAATRFDETNHPYYVIRGGSFALNNYLATSAGRNGNAGNWMAYGFRLAFAVGE